VQSRSYTIENKQGKGTSEYEIGRRFLLEIEILGFPCWLRVEGESILDETVRNTRK
jgi:hypothetical protein